MKPTANEALTREARERRWPNLRPKDAATLIIVDRSGAEPRLLMGKRHAGHKFMPGKFVFPGGRIDPSDRLMSTDDELSPDVAARLGTRLRRPSRHLPRSLALAAIRETFEETGLLLGNRVDRPVKAPAGIWQDFAARGVAPALSGVTFIARAITPPRRPKRFDTRFMTVDAQSIAGRVEGVVGPDSELVELTWVSIGDALKLDLPAITQVVLGELRGRIDEGFPSDRPTPFYYEVRRVWQRDLL
jgi:8-oxo-dGTP pyrophosphatase MutT (NUDIX family)